MFKSMRRALRRPAPRCNLAGMRLVIVGFALWNLVIAEVHAGGDVIATRSDQPVLWLEPLLALGLPSAETFETSRALACAIGVAAWIGWKTPWTLASFALANLVLRAWLASNGRFDHIHAIAAIALLGLACSPAGAELSLDARLRSGRWNDARRRSRDATWPSVFIGLLLTLAYFSAATTKLVGAGFEWCNGSTLQFYAYFKGVPLDAPFGPWLSTQHSLAVVLSWAAIVFEMTFALALFAPKTRAFYLAAGTLFHVFAHLSVAAPFYSFVALYSCWIPWSALSSRLSPQHHAR